MSTFGCQHQASCVKAVAHRLLLRYTQVTVMSTQAGHHNTLILGLRYSKILEYRPKISNTCQIRTPNTQCANLKSKPAVRALRNGLSHPRSLHSMPDPLPRGVEWSHVITRHQEKHERGLNRGDLGVKCIHCDHRDRGGASRIKTRLLGTKQD